MASERVLASRLFTTSVIEGRTELDERYDKAYNSVINLTKNLSEKEAHDVLNKHFDDRKVHDDICLGLLIGILSDQQSAPRHYQDLTLLSRDSLKGVTDTLIQVVGERYNRLLDMARIQLLWLVKEMVKTGVNNVEGIVWNLLRQIAGGDISPKNVWLAENLVDILREHRAWLDKFSVIVASVAYTYLRILEDHHGPAFANLRQKEVNFVIGLLRERFQDCMKIGRDLVRLLQNIARIPEIESFWKDLLHNPTSLAPNFTGILQLLQTRTSRRFFVVRLTPEMEKKMVFLCTDVKFGNQKRYQEWFQRQCPSLGNLRVRLTQLLGGSGEFSLSRMLGVVGHAILEEWVSSYLNTPESQTLRCDLIRFIIGCIHPSNEVLCSDIIPRWAVIGWLLSSCTSPVATANSKLSLFYDWLFYNTETDNIMNIEPGILVMYHSLRPHPVLTTSLLDFLCRIIPNFHPTLTEKVKAGVYNSLNQILEKRVVQTLDPLFDNARMDLELRRLVRDTFPDFCAELKQHEEFPLPVSSPAAVTKMDLLAETGLDFGSSVSLGGTGGAPDAEPNHANHSGDDDAAFSDEDDDEDSKMQFTLSAKPTVGPPPGGTRIKTEIKTEDTGGSNTISSGGNNNNNGSSLPNNTSNVGATLIGVKSNHASAVLDSAGVTPPLGGPPTSNCVAENEFKNVLRTTYESLTTEERTEFRGHLEYLEKDTKNFLEDMLLERDVQSRCNILQKICDLIFSEDLDAVEAQHLAACLSYLLSNDLNCEESLLPPKVTPETLDESMTRPLYVLFDNLITLTEDDHRRQSLMHLLAELHKASPPLGYHFLYFLKATLVRREKEEQEQPCASMQTYRDLCKASGQKDFTGFILKDLQICCERDPRLISWVVPDIYKTFPRQTMGNVELLHMVLERLDSSQLHDLVCMVLQGSLQMFDNNSFANILEKSLQWETVEQIFLWQLARAHEIPVDCCLTVLPKLKFSSHTDSVIATHGEALSNILMMLRRESPSETLLRHLLLRELRPSDPTVATILQYWVQRYEDKMAKLVYDLINSKQHHPSPNKRKRNQGPKSANHSSSSVPLDQVLSHLNHLRTACDQTKFFELSTMQEALQTAQAQCPESQKRKYNDLFALIVEDEPEVAPPETQRKAKSNRGRKPKARKKRESETEEESSEEEDIKKPSRKRKKNNQLGSDSD